MWTTVSSLSVPRDAVGVCLLGDRLYAVGGYDGQSYLSTVESYDALNNEWTEVNSLKGSSSFQIYQENHNACSTLEKIAVLAGPPLREALRRADEQGCARAVFLSLRLICMK